MVGTISWFSQLRRLKNRHHSRHHSSRWMAPTNHPETLGILAFDTAKSMCRLISLYKSLSDQEINRLRTCVIPSKGISFLTSQDENFLLNLACAERLEELDRNASVVARLGLKCIDFGLVRFDQVYRDLKNGYVNLDKLNLYGSKDMKKSVDKMEKFTTSTGELYAEVQSLVELETSEKKLNEWRKNNNGVTNYDFFDQKICSQRKIVRRLKETSLWGQTHDKIVSLMAKMISVLYARICILFSPHVPILPSNKNDACKSHKKSKCTIQPSVVCSEMTHKLFDSSPAHNTTMSGQLSSAIPRIPLVRFLSTNSNVFNMQDLEAKLGIKFDVQVKTYTQVGAKNNNRVFQAAPPTTVGGSGLCMRYANLILVAEKYFKSNIIVGDQARHNLYNMLPSNVKMYVKAKLKVAWQESVDEDGADNELADGWRDGVDEILDWLVPMAHDTLTWQQERNMEKQKFDSKPTVLLLQTLHYADLDKTEAAISEVLVGLSCIYWYENRRVPYLDMYS